MRRSVVLSFAAALAAMILAAPAASWAWPADGQVIRAFSLGDDPYAGGQHRGVDIAADSGSSEPAAEETTADDSDPDGAGVAGVAVGAVAEVAPAPPSSADGSTDVGDPQASASAAQTDGAGEEM